MMRASRQVRAMAEIAPLVRRPVDVRETDQYRQIGIRSFGKGVFHKGQVSGLDLGNKKVFEIWPGDLLFNIVFAWEGAVAVAAKSEEGMIGSHRFLTCRVNDELASAKYLYWHFIHAKGLEKLLRASPGGAGGNRTLNINKLEAITIELPSLDEQHRVVTRLDHVEQLVHEIKKLRSEVREGYDRLCRSFVYGEPAQMMPLRQILSQQKSDVTVMPEAEYQFAGVYSFGRGVFAGETKAGNQFSYNILSKVRAGQFIYPKLMAWEGALGVVPMDCDGRYVSPEFCVFECDTQMILPEVLDVIFRDPLIWPKLHGTSKGTNVRRQRLHPETFLDLVIPVPLMKTQKQIKRMVEHRNHVLAKAEGGLDALLPAMLHEIFGESVAA